MKQEDKNTKTKMDERLKALLPENKTVESPPEEEKKGGGLVFHVRTFKGDRWFGIDEVK